MKYERIISGRFLERPNRFIAYIDVDGRREKVHVKNTGRCRELLQPNAQVYLEQSDNPERSTAFDLVAVKKGDRIINMDSQAPNKAVGEWLETGAYFKNIISIRPETVYGNSRFDFYVETETEKIFIEVKGVTLEKNNIVSFPDAPSDRAVKHVQELIAAKQEGYRVFVLFVIQMEGTRYLVPNYDTHREFGEALSKAAEAGVEVMAWDCVVTPDSMTLKQQVPVVLREDGGVLYEMVEPLLKWYDDGHRKLPWREIPTPYRVWVSEIMLQQTRVEAVKPYFERFMNALPDIKALAEADEETLLKLWEGLGYYNRVRNLQKAAIQIQEHYGGSMPSDYDELLKLAGIGSYTAGAISSIAFGVRRPAVDGNVLRVVSRLRMDASLISDAKVKAKVEADLLEVMPETRPGDFNQAMMEIGACVCIPNGAPLCEACPLNKLCLAHGEGCEADYPKKEKKNPRTIEKKTVLILRDENKTVIHKRDNKGLLAGLYEFPMMEGHQSAKAVIQYLEKCGIKTLHIRKLEPAKHIFSHKEWHMVGYMVRVDELEPKKVQESEVMENTDVHFTGADGWIYIEPEETKEKYPIPSAFATYTKYLSIKLGNHRFEEE